MIEIQKPKRRRKTRIKPVRQHRRQNGVSMIELVISAMLLVTVMTFVTTLSYSVNLVWKDIGHHRVAAGELSNQLESLTRLSHEEARKAVASLQPSEVCARTLLEPEIAGKLVDDNLGTRIELRINWNRRNPGKPVELVGWIPQNRTVDTASKSEADQ